MTNINTYNQKRLNLKINGKTTTIRVSEDLYKLFGLLEYYLVLDKKEEEEIKSKMTMVIEERLKLLKETNATMTYTKIIEDYVFTRCYNKLYSEQIKLV